MDIVAKLIRFVGSSPSSVLRCILFSASFYHSRSRHTHRVYCLRLLFCVATCHLLLLFIHWCCWCCGCRRWIDSLLTFALIPFLHLLRGYRVCLCQRTMKRNNIQMIEWKHVLDSCLAAEQRTHNTESIYPHHTHTRHRPIDDGHAA